MKKVILLTSGIIASLFFASCSTEKAESVAEETIDKTEEMAHDAHEAAEEMVTPEAQVIKLSETPGAFATEEMTLEAGTYSFEVTNEGVDHPVAFVLAPSKEDLQQEEWITDAMLTAAVKDGETASSKKAVTLEAGEYVYFCPMNPTPQYKLTVK